MFKGRCFAIQIGLTVFLRIRREAIKEMAVFEHLLHHFGLIEEDSYEIINKIEENFNVLLQALKIFKFICKEKEIKKIFNNLFYALQDQPLNLLSDFSILKQIQKLPEEIKNFFSKDFINKLARSFYKNLITQKQKGKRQLRDILRILPQNQNDAFITALLKIILLNQTMGSQKIDFVKMIYEIAKETSSTFDSMNWYERLTPQRYHKLCEQNNTF